MYVFASITSGLALAYVVSSEQIDAWGELSAVAVLGALCVGFGFLHWNSQKLWAKTMMELVKEKDSRNTKCHHE